MLYSPADLRLGCFTLVCNAEDGPQSPQCLQGEVVLLQRRMHLDQSLGPLALRQPSQGGNMTMVLGQPVLKGLSVRPTSRCDGACRTWNLEQIKIISCTLYNMYLFFVCINVRIYSYVNHHTYIRVHSYIPRALDQEGERLSGLCFWAG